MADIVYILWRVVSFVPVFSKVGCEDPVHRSSQKEGVMVKRVKRDTLSSNEILMLDTYFTAFVTISKFSLQDTGSPYFSPNIFYVFSFFNKMTCFQSRFSFDK